MAYLQVIDDDGIYNLSLFWILDQVLYVLFIFFMYFCLLLTDDEFRSFTRDILRSKIFVDDKYPLGIGGIYSCVRNESEVQSRDAASRLKSS